MKKYTRIPSIWKWTYPIDKDWNVHWANKGWSLVWVSLPNLLVKFFLLRFSVKTKLRNKIYHKSSNKSPPLITMQIWIIMNPSWLMFLILVTSTCIVNPGNCGSLRITFQCVHGSFYSSLIKVHLYTSSIQLFSPRGGTGSTTGRVHIPGNQTIMKFVV